MADTTKLPIKSEKKVAVQETDHSFARLRREMNHLFDEYDRAFWPISLWRNAFDLEPFWRRELSWAKTPAVDIVEHEKAFEISADLPGFDEKDIEVKLSNGNIVIKGEKKAEKEEKEKDYYLRERRFDSFERSFGLPETVDTEKLEAAFKKGVLTITLPKKPGAQAPEKKIEVKAA